MTNKINATLEDGMYEELQEKYPWANNDSERVRWAIQQTLNDGSELDLNIQIEDQDD